MQPLRLHTSQVRKIKCGTTEMHHDKTSFADRNIGTFQVLTGTVSFT